MKINGLCGGKKEIKPYAYMWGKKESCERIIFEKLTCKNKYFVRKLQGKWNHMPTLGKKSFERIPCEKWTCENK